MSVDLTFRLTVDNSNLELVSKNNSNILIPSNTKHMATCSKAQQTGNQLYHLIQPPQQYELVSVVAEPEMCLKTQGLQYLEQEGIAHTHAHSHSLPRMLSLLSKAH